jgi:hypothetical protein
MKTARPVRVVQSGTLLSPLKIYVFYEGVRGWRAKTIETPYVPPKGYHTHEAA